MSSASRSKNFRRRGVEDDGKAQETAASPSAPSTSGRLPSKLPSSKPKKLLSFEEEEDDNPSSGSITKANLVSSRKQFHYPTEVAASQKVTFSRERRPPSPPKSYRALQDHGSYTKEALLELQKNTRILAKPSSKPPPITSEPKIILTGILKPTDDTSCSNKKSGTDVDGVSGQDSSQSGVEADKSNDSSIPDEDMIKRIRAKRERMRYSRSVASDFISLDGPCQVSEGLSDEEPEFRTRIAMIGKETKSASGVFQGDNHVGTVATVLGKSSVYDSKQVSIHESTELEEDEDKIWEEEQFRKGLGKRIDDGLAASRVMTHTAPASAAIMNMYNQVHPISLVQGDVTSLGGGLRPGATQVTETFSLAQQAEISRKALHDNIRRLKESHDKTVTSVEKTDQNLTASLLNITTLEKSLSAAGEKFIFMQKLRDFVSVICEFLQHKAPFIEELEEQMQDLHKQRASAIIQRRESDNRDEMAEVEASINAAKQILRDRDASPAIIAAAADAAQAALVALKEEQNLSVKLDEFGRDINQQKRMDLKRRAEARKRRKDRFDAKRFTQMEINGDDQKIEGEWSTDESDSESSAYQSNRDLLLQTAGQIFSDASEEYSELSAVKQHFEQWKKEYAKSYQDAYMSLNAPAIFSPYVRLELLKWDPLHEDKDFFDMRWHSLLFNYDAPEDDSVSPDDNASNLVPRLVEQVAIPFLHVQIAHCWDILSTRETVNVVSATTLITNYIPASSGALAKLLIAVHTRLAEAVDNIVVPTWAPHLLKAVPSAARVAAYRFGTSIRLMRNICLWKDLLKLPVLEKLVLVELLYRKVLPHLQSIASNIHDAVTRAERTVSALSGVWAGTYVTSEHSDRLQPLVKCILMLSNTLERRHALSISDTETATLARRLKKMLIELNDYDNARAISRTFRLKEAL